MHYINFWLTAKKQINNNDIAAVQSTLKVAGTISSKSYNNNLYTTAGLHIKEHMHQKISLQKSNRAPNVFESRIDSNWIGDSHYNK